MHEVSSFDSANIVWGKQVDAHEALLIYLDSRLEVQWSRPFLSKLTLFRTSCTIIDCRCTRAHFLFVWIQNSKSNRNSSTRIDRRLDTQETHSLSLDLRPEVSIQRPGYVYTSSPPISQGATLTDRVIWASQCFLIHVKTQHVHWDLQHPRQDFLQPHRLARNHNYILANKFFSKDRSCCLSLASETGTAV